MKLTISLMNKRKFKVRIKIYQIEFSFKIDNFIHKIIKYEKETEN